MSWAVEEIEGIEGEYEKWEVEVDKDSFESALTAQIIERKEADLL